MKIYKIEINGRTFDVIQDTDGKFIRPEINGGSALKPANEPICLARKPLSEKTIVDNVIKWGTGGINVDGCRIGTETIMTNMKNTKGGLYNLGNQDRTNEVENTFNEGRFPANILFDESAAEMLDEQSGISKSVGPLKYDFDDAPNQDNSTKLTKNIKSGVHFNDKGGASRFFYVTKSNQDLIDYLTKLITPENGTILIYSKT